MSVRCRCARLAKSLRPPPNVRTLCALPPMTYADRAPLFIYYDYSHISSPGATRTRADGMYRISMVKHALNQHGISFNAALDSENEYGMYHA
jgi:hypothetical protein